MSSSSSRGVRRAGMPHLRSAAPMASPVPVHQMARSKQRGARAGDHRLTKGILDGQPYCHEQKSRCPDKERRKPSVLSRGLQKDAETERQREGNHPEMKRSGQFEPGRPRRQKRHEQRQDEAMYEARKRDTDRYAVEQVLPADAGANPAHWTDLFQVHRLDVMLHHLVIRKSCLNRSAVSRLAWSLVRKLAAMRQGAARCASGSAGADSGSKATILDALAVTRPCPRPSGRNRSPRMGCRSPGRGASHRCP